MQELVFPRFAFASALTLLLTGCSGCNDDPTDPAGGAGGTGSTSSSTATHATQSASSTTASTSSASTGEGGAGGAVCAIVQADRFGTAAATSWGRVVIGPGGDVWVLGRTSDLEDFGGDPATATFTVSRLHADGQPVWTTELTQTGQGGLTGIAVDTDGNAFVTGGFSASLQAGSFALQSAGGFDGLLVGLDPDGGVIWAHGFGDVGQQGFFAAQLDVDGTVVLGGWFDGEIDLGGGPLVAVGTNQRPDFFVARFAMDGTYLGDKRFGAESDELLGSLVLAPNGAIVVSGTYKGTPDFGGGQLPDGFYDGFVLELDPDFGFRWNVTLESTSGFAGVDAANGVHLLGNAFGVVDLGGAPIGTPAKKSLVRLDLDAGGHHTNSHAWLLPDDGFVPSGAAVEPGGAIWLTALAEGPFDLGMGTMTPAGGTDLFVARLEGNDFTYTLLTGDDTDQQAGPVTVTPMGHAIVAGEFHGELDLCKDPLTAVNHPDAFLIEIAP